MQFIIEGKADLAARAYKKWIDFIYRPKARPHMIFLSDEDMILSEHLVRPWETCGTSGKFEKMNLQKGKNNDH